MRKLTRIDFLFSICILLLADSSRGQEQGTVIEVYPDSVISDISAHPVGINLDYFTDDDNYLQPERSTTDAIKAGCKNSAVSGRKQI
ncbi:MAG: hypothetical protein P1P82_12760 [Bacteroidales bacterium]|nr:hypothetical protein [Bacteroidales bacterium]MDT8432375.1 hypothetical protein [Bacteroidales bacterium]